MAELNITNIPAPRVPFVDERTGLMAREWYRFFLNLFVLTGSGNNPITLEELQLGPPSQPSLAELLIQINQNIAPQYEDQSGDFLATLDTAQLMSMMSRFENAEAAIQGAYLQPVVQTGTIANYNLDGSPTAGGIAYGTGPALAVSAAGTLGQVLTSAGAGTPTWAAAATGTVSSVSVVSANGLAGTVATATTTPAITLSTTITGLLKGNGTAISAATSGTDYAPATSGTSILYGNGSGGFSNVTIGTGVAFAGGTLSATGSGGTVTSVAALTLGTTGTDLSSTVANGTTTPVITLQVPTASATNRGALSAADWTTFNNKGSGTVTSVAQSFTGGLISVAGSPITTSGTLALTVAGTSGGIPYFSSGTTWATSAALTASALVVGGGAGAAPATTTTGTGVVTALGVNTGTAGAFVVNGGALGTPSSGTVTNLTGTASININGTVGATTASTGAFTTVSASGIISTTATGTAVTIGSTSGTSTRSNIRFDGSSAAPGAINAYVGVNVTSTDGSLDLLGNNATGLHVGTTGVVTANNGISVTGTLTTTSFITVNSANASFAWNWSGVEMISTNGNNNTGTAANAAVTIFRIRADNITGRSISAGGTLNALGTDYAEYMTKASDFTIAKGDVVGINAQGKLTNVFTDAVSFVVKSTNPSYVGGDAWGNEDEIGKKPTKPVQIAATDDAETETDEAFAVRMAQYETDKTAFDAALEAARQKVDRIAFAGQVPVNVTGATAGQYIIPINDNGAIKGEAVSKPTFEQYQISVGKVIAIEADGRAKIIVKVA